MTQENKELLFKALCALLPYGIKILHNGWDSDGGCEFSTVETLIGINDRFIYTLWRDERDKHSIVEPLSITDYKPFLRPMSSMTEEEKKEYCDLQDKFLLSSQYPVTDAYALFDWLDKNMFDYRGLIEKGLALEAPDDMYLI